MKRRLALLLAAVLWAGIAPAPQPITPPSFSTTVSAQTVVRRPIVTSAACSVFPCNAVLDNFNRADSGTLGSNWTAGTRPSWNVDLTISSNKASGGSSQSDYWNVTTFGNGEVYVTVSGTGLSQMVLWRLANLNSASFTGYELLVSGPTTAQVYRWDDSSTAVQLGSDITVSFAAGDSMGIQHIGSTIKCYRCASGGACGVSGAGWSQIGSDFTDGTYSTGYIGIKGGDYFDDFGGGAR